MTHSPGRNIADIKCSCIDQILKSTTPVNPFSCSTIKINQGIVDNSQQFLPDCGYSTFQCTFGRHVYIFSYPVPPAVLTTRFQVSLVLVPVTSHLPIPVSSVRTSIIFPTTNSIPMFAYNSQSCSRRTTFETVDLVWPMFKKFKETLTFTT